MPSCHRKLNFAPIILLSFLCSHKYAIYRLSVILTKDKRYAAPNRLFPIEHSLLTETHEKSTVEDKRGQKIDDTCVLGLLVYKFSCLSKHFNFNLLVLHAIHFPYFSLTRQISYGKLKRYIILKTTREFIYSRVLFFIRTRRKTQVLLLLFPFHNKKKEEFTILSITSKNMRTNISSFCCSLLL